VAKMKTTTCEKQQTADQRSNLMSEDLAFQPINRSGTVNRFPSDRQRVQWADHGRSAPPCRPVVSLRFPSLLLVPRRFSGVPHQICVERRLWAAAVLQRRSDPGRNVSEQAPRQERDYPSTPLKSCQDGFGTKRSQQGSRGTLALINSLTV